MSSSIQPSARLAADSGDGVVRCVWCFQSKDPHMRALYERYHDTEWGRELRDDRGLFEMICLEAAQAGLSWATVLKKREAYRAAFDGFDMARVARYGEEKIAQLLQDEGIIRNRSKIAACIHNAQILERVLESERCSLADLMWRLGTPNGEPVHNKPLLFAHVVPETDQSRRMSTALRDYGLKFCGPTICYALMQSVGMINDHSPECHVYKDIAEGGHRAPADVGAASSTSSSSPVTVPATAAARSSASRSGSNSNSKKRAAPGHQPTDRGPAKKKTKTAKT